MKQILTAFGQVVSQARSDAMLFLCCLAPLLMGAVFKWGIPLADRLLSGFVPISLLPYYPLFDLLLCAAVPFLLCFVPSMVILGEIDDRISSYLAVTPLGKGGYLLSRLGIPVALSTLATPFLCLLFGLSRLPFGMLAAAAVCSGAQGLVETLLVTCLSSNKLEGIAVAKLSGLFLLGVPAPFFLSGPAEYLLSPLPGLWLAKAVLQNNWLYFAVSLLVSGIWAGFLFRRFQRKLAR